MRVIGRLAQLTALNFPRSGGTALSYSVRLLLATSCCFATAPMVASAADAAPSSSDSSRAQPPQGALEEITVTATRRTERLQDVPYNITGISADALAQAGATSINSLAQLVSGLQTMDTGPNARGGNNQFSMRGLRTDSPGSETDGFRGGTVAPVSTYLGETPIFFPMALKDLERVEVLKGPQGTLYGSGALAGTIRFIPNRPQFDEFSGAFDVQGSWTGDSDELSNAADGVLNVPLADRLALRVSAGYERLGGFIDAVNIVERSVRGDPESPPVLRVPADIFSGYVIGPVEKDTNSSERWYVRPVLRWQATEAVDAELSYVHQDLDVDGMQIANDSYPGGTYTFDSYSGSPNAVNTFRPGGRYKQTLDIVGSASSKVDLGSLVVTADLDAALLTSASSLYHTSGRDYGSYTPSTQIFNPDGSLAFNYYDYFFGYPRANQHSISKQREETFVQELRLVSTWDKPVDYIVGLYYQDQRYNFEYRATEPGYTDYLTALNDPSLVPRPDGDLVYYYIPGTGFDFEDQAVFGELTWHITPEWEVTGGARVFRQEFVNRQTALNYYFTPTPVVDLDVKNTSTVSDQIFKFNTSYDFSPDLKLYATYSEGFRRGGANGLPQDGPYASLPTLLSYVPDKSKNVEIGLKGMLLDNRVRYTVSAFDIKLENYQFNSYSASSFPAVFNGTDVQSRGAELEAQVQISPDLTVGFSYAYTDAKVLDGFTIMDLVPLTLFDSPDDPQTMPAVTIAEGARLPVTPKNSANVFVDYILPFESAALQFHADLAYRSSAPGYVDPASARYWEIPSSTLMNVRVTYDSGNDWTADLFVNNLTDEIVYSGAFGTGQTQPNLFQHRYVGRPRNIGVGFHYRW